MVRNDRYGLRAWGIIFIGLSIFLGFMPLSFLLPDLQQSTSAFVEDFFNPIFFNLLCYLLFTLLWGSALLIQAPRWQLVNYRRQIAAAWGFAARVPLAQPHPLPNVRALPVPFAIKLRPNWTFFLAPLGGIAGLFLLFQTNFNFPGDGVLGWITGALLGFSLFSWPQKIEITQEGLTVRHTFYDWWETDIRWRLGKRTIRWNEARLFAVRDGKPGEPAIHYELSSPYNIAQWKRICCLGWWSLYQPAIPFAQYDAQMEALIALISGITGLPLYDVR